MPATTPCPGPDKFERLLRGLLPARDVTTLTDHLEYCPRCQDVVRRLGSDDSLHEALPAARRAELPRGEVVEGLMRRLCRLGPPAAPEPTPPPAGDTSELYPFLAPPQGPHEMGRLGGYRVLRLLGSGGMGIVFEAEDVK